MLLFRQQDTSVQHYNQMNKTWIFIWFLEKEFYVCGRRHFRHVSGNNSEMLSRKKDSLWFMKTDRNADCSSCAHLRKWTHPIFYDDFRLIHNCAVPQQPQGIVDCKWREEIHVQSGPRASQGPVEAEAQKSLHVEANMFLCRVTLPCHRTCRSK